MLSKTVQDALNDWDRREGWGAPLEEGRSAWGARDVRFSVPRCGLSFSCLRDDRERGWDRRRGPIERAATSAGGARIRTCRTMDSRNYPTARGALFPS